MRSQSGRFSYRLWVTDAGLQQLKRAKKESVDCMAPVPPMAAKRTREYRHRVFITYAPTYPKRKKKKEVPCL